MVLVALALGLLPSLPEGQFSFEGKKGQKPLYFPEALAKTSHT